METLIEPTLEVAEYLDRITNFQEDICTELEVTQPLSTIGLIENESDLLPQHRKRLDELKRAYQGIILNLNGGYDNLDEYEINKKLELGSFYMLVKSEAIPKEMKPRIANDYDDFLRKTDFYFQLPELDQSKEPITIRIDITSSKGINLEEKYNDWESKITHCPSYIGVMDYEVISDDNETRYKFKALTNCVHFTISIDQNWSQKMYDYWEYQGEGEEAKLKAKEFSNIFYKQICEQILKQKQYMQSQRLTTFSRHRQYLDSLNKVWQYAIEFNSKDL